MPVKHYVLGFCFSEDGQYVTLLKKASDCPLPFLRNRLNGIGGNVEESDGPTGSHGYPVPSTVMAAMRREWREEVSTDDVALTWRQVFHFIPHGGNVCVHVFTGLVHSGLHRLYANSDSQEPVKPISVVSVQASHDNHLAPNLKWMMNLAWDLRNTRRVTGVDFRDTGVI